MSEDLEAPDESRLIRIAKNGVRVRGKIKLLTCLLQSGGIWPVGGRVALLEKQSHAINSSLWLVVFFGCVSKLEPKKLKFKTKIKMNSNV